MLFKIQIHISLYGWLKLNKHFWKSFYIWIFLEHLVLMISFSPIQSLIAIFFFCLQIHKLLTLFLKSQKNTFQIVSYVKYCFSVLRPIGWISLENPFGVEVLCSFVKQQNINLDSSDVLIMVMIEVFHLHLDFVWFFWGNFIELFSFIGIFNIKAVVFL